MMNSMKQEMKHEKDGSVGKVAIDVKQKTVKNVFEDGPDQIADQEASHRLSKRKTKFGTKIEVLLDGAHEKGSGDGQPNNGHNVPGGTCEDLQVPRTKEPSRLREVTWLMNLLKVEVLGKVAVPHLRDKRSSEVEELISSIVSVHISRSGLEVIVND